MVNRVNVSKWQGPLPSETDLSSGRRRIKERKLYDEAELLAIASGGESKLVQWTAGAQRDIAALTWDNNDVLDLLKLAINTGTRHRPEWCVQSPVGPLAACDVFTVYRTETGKSDGVKRLMQYYLKVAVSRTGKLLLVASCHTTEK